MIELQTNSYREFLQTDTPPSKRKNTGLQAVFTEVFPIESYDGKCVLDFHSYEIGEPKHDWLECLREGITYGAPLHVTFLLKEEKGAKEEKVFMGELPLMTPQGTFVINGAERVIVSQLHRSPGLAFEASSIPTARCSIPSASSRTAVPGTRPSSTPAICSTSISTAKSAAANS